MLLTELNEILDNFRLGIPLQRSDELRNLADEIANQVRHKMNIDEWAKRLAGDVSVLTD